MTALQKLTSKLQPFAVLCLPQLFECYYHTSQHYKWQSRIVMSATILIITPFFCNSHCQTTVANVTLPKVVLSTFKSFTVCTIDYYYQEYNWVKFQKMKYIPLESIFKRYMLNFVRKNPKQTIKTKLFWPYKCD